jgi:hypothetical protein
MWFYIGNHKPGLPERVNTPPKYEPFWVEDLPMANLIDIPELVMRIRALKAKGVTGALVAYSFFERRIQPLQRKVTYGYEYRGTADPSRMAKDVPSMEEIMQRVQRILDKVYSEPYVPKLFC